MSTQTAEPSGAAQDARCDRYRAFFEAIADAAFVIDHESGLIIDVNGAAARLYAASRDELVGSTLASWSMDPAGTAKAIEDVQHLGVRPHRRKDGATFPAEISWRLVVLEGRKLLVGVIRDITDRRLADEALRESEERFNLAMEATRDGVWDWDVRADQAYWSPSYYRMLGYEPGELPSRGESWVALIHPDDEARARELTTDCLEGRREGFRLEYRMKAKDGQWRWILDRCKVVARDESGRAVRLLGTHVDITERKTAEEALRRSAQAVQLSEARMQIAQEIGHAGSWVYEMETDRIWGSAEALRMFGYAPVDKLWSMEEIEGCILERERVHRALVDLLREGCEYNLEYTIRPADGSPDREIHSIARLERDAEGKALRIVGFVQDVTERKRTEQSLRRLAAELAEANRLKDIFTDVLRHDILNPVNVIKLATELLIARESCPNGKDLLDKIQRSVASLTEMTESAAKLAAVSGTLALELPEGDPVRVVRSVIAEFEHKINEKNLTLVPPSATGVRAEFDPILREVFANLISNAIKYCPEGSRIDVAVEDRGDSWTFSVRDQGPGVSDAHKQKIFNRFERLGKEGVKGTGLGLTIARQIVILHGGEIRVEDAPGGGAVFVVTMSKRPPRRGESV